MLFFYQARCALCPNDHRLHIFPFLLCYVRMMSVHSVLHEAFAQRLSGMFFSNRKCVVRNLFVYPKSEEGEISLDWVVRPDFTNLSTCYQLVTSLLSPISTFNCPLSTVCCELTIFRGHTLIIYRNYPKKVKNNAARNTNYHKYDKKI